MSYLRATRFPYYNYGVLEVVMKLATGVVSFSHLHQKLPFLGRSYRRRCDPRCNKAFPTLWVHWGNKKKQDKNAKTPILPLSHFCVLLALLLETCNNTLLLRETLYHWLQGIWSFKTRKKVELFQKWPKVLPWQTKLFLKTRLYTMSSLMSGNISFKIACCLVPRSSLKRSLKLRAA